MESILMQMMKKYDSSISKMSLIKQVIQECILSSISRTDFFDFAAFYGGTALRMFYGLDRFSEDLDFSLMNKDKNFSIEKYLENIEKDLLRFGLEFEASTKEKNKDTNILSAFIKGTTKETILSFNVIDEVVNPNELIKIKFEVDILPPDGASFEKKYLVLPYYSRINVYDEASLFAGKLHAVICRAWKNRVKGRDLYDYLFYLARKSPINLEHLKNRLLDSGYLKEDKPISKDDVKKILFEKFDTINFNEAKKDILPFVNDKYNIDIWDKDLFISMTKDYFL